MLTSVTVALGAVLLLGAIGLAYVWLTTPPARTPRKPSPAASKQSDHD